MDRRRTSEGFKPSFVRRNHQHIVRLRRRIKELEEEANELHERLALLMADLHENMINNHDLRVFTKEVHQQLQQQDTLNESLEEEIQILRQMIQQDQQLASQVITNCLAYVSQIGSCQDVNATQDDGINQDVSIACNANDHKDVNTMVMNHQDAKKELNLDDQSVNTPPNAKSHLANN